ncbi:MAG: nucleoprotein/polynucleotide-associated enzyme [Gammaproteobacteria bacterium RIFCSPHIGHO2_12_FULL_63_22]|nr:MAG: nucleoprotein/polynucleotide-associated enzyme [Gammaproteobacteria bacterium RIFCSPHIGHO2_12_FULL_63_22]
MSNSLRDQLLGLGYKPAPKPEPAAVERKPHVPNERGAKGQQREGGRHDSRGKPAHVRSGQDKPSSAAPSSAKPGDRRPGDRRPAHGRPASANAAPRPARTREEIDLAKAYALRAQKEKDDRIEAERIKQEEAKLRREAKAQLGVLLKDKALNDPAAEIARHFQYGGKIKRIYVNAEQLKALNAGELGVAQMDGRYLLVPLALLLEAEAIFPPSVALKVDPDAAPGEDPYSDPAYQVPDDLVW